MRANVSATLRRIPLPGRILAIGVAAAIALTVAVAMVRSSDTHRITAYFANSTGLYTGDPVTVRGVRIGTVDRIEPIGDRVGVRMSYDADNFVPADTHAVIVAPTLVSGRYVQLTTDSHGQPALADGAEIPLERTAVPVEYDQVKKQLDQLATEIGPQQGHDGSLSRLANATSAALSGNGTTLKQTLTNLSAAAQTLAQGGPDLFSTVRNLQGLVSALAAGDQQITQFTGQLSSLSRLLDDNRTQLDAAVGGLQAMLPEIRTFVKDNHTALAHDVDALTRISRLLVNRQDDLAQILHVAPTALGDLYNIYDPRSRTLTAAVSVADYPEPMSFICALLTTVNAPQQECSRASHNFGDLFASALRAAQPPAPSPPPLALPQLLIPGLGVGR
ncbi:mammalian cell entry protein [Nocardia nova]|uniref:Mammalian cell entry protein n=1 Tax=Nocardia nova TaxID=37330 RepID=A0A2S6AKJ3_9NOCA|nr:MCE family protein [Nocardia nova]PPJ24961.1 mammalian cell entry protein [Nocardia nova]PPJ35723.1 mammalian cell entry protein [Nocardia nova]